MSFNRQHLWWSLELFLTILTLAGGRQLDFCPEKSEEICIILFEAKSNIIPRPFVVDFNFPFRIPQ